METPSAGSRRTLVLETLNGRLAPHRVYEALVFAIYSDGLQLAVDLFLHLVYSRSQTGFDVNELEPALLRGYGTGQGGIGVASNCFPPSSCSAGLRSLTLRFFVQKRLNSRRPTKRALCYT